MVQVLWDPDAFKMATPKVDHNVSKGNSWEGLDLDDTVLNNEAFDDLLNPELQRRRQTHLNSLTPCNKHKYVRQTYQFYKMRTFACGARANYKHIKFHHRTRCKYDRKTLQTNITLMRSMMTLFMTLSRRRRNSILTLNTMDQDGLNTTKSFDQYLPLKRTFFNMRNFKISDTD